MFIRLYTFVRLFYAQLVEVYHKDKYFHIGVTISDTILKPVLLLKTTSTGYHKVTGTYGYDSFRPRATDADGKDGFA